MSDVAAGSVFAVIGVWGVVLAVVVVAALCFVVLAAALFACPPLLVRVCYRSKFRVGICLLGSSILVILYWGR